jgi:branched-chain amino acid transport system permease protein
MELFIQQIVAGLFTGSIYACLALGIGMIYRAIGHVNFAQGEMAMFSTFVAWQLIQWGTPYWIAFVATLVFSFVAAGVIHQVVMRPLAKADEMSNIAVFIGMFAMINSLSGFIWNFNVKTFPSPFGFDSFLGSKLISLHQAGVLLVVVVLLLGLGAFFRFSRAGLHMQAAAANPESARLVGIRVNWMKALGWGMASTIGAVAGMMIAPLILLDPNMMSGVLIYAIAGAVVGGITSPVGAVIGGLAVGVIENLSGTYIPVVGGELKLTIAMALIIVVLLVRPNGLLGKNIAHRV